LAEDIFSLWKTRGHRETLKKGLPSNPNWKGSSEYAFLFR